MEPRTSAILAQPSCGTFGQHRLCNLARHISSMHAPRAEVLADSSKSAFQVRKPSQSPRRHAEIVPDSAGRRHRSFRFSCIMRIPCCHVLPLSTMLPCYQTSNPRVSKLRMPSAHRYPDTLACVCFTVSLFVRMCEQQFHYRHRCGEEGHGASPLYCALGPTALSMVGFKIRQGGSVCV